MKKFFLVLASVISFSVLLKAEDYPKLWLKQDFEDKRFFTPESVTNGETEFCKWSNLAMPHTKIVTSDNKKYSQSLLITRFESRTFDFTGLHAMPANRDYILSFDVYLKRSEKTFCVLMDKNNKFIAGVNLEGANGVKMFDKLGTWGTSGITMPEGWAHIEVKFDVAEKNCIAKLVDSDGGVFYGMPMPMLTDNVPVKLRFGTVLPLNTIGVIDNLEIRYTDHAKIDKRENLVESAKISLKKIKKSADGSMTLAKKNGVIQYNLSSKSEVSSIRFAATPSMKIKIKAINNANKVQTIAEPWEFVTVENKYQQVDFAPGVFQKFYFECEGKVGDQISEIGIYGAKVFSRGAQDEAFQKKVSGEFQLPIYELEKEHAELHLFNITQKDIPVQVVLRERYTGKEYDRINQTLKNGKNIVKFNIKNLPEGHYIAEIEDFSTPKETVKGSMRRLLRRITVPKPTFATNLDMTGEKMLFPDNYYLAEHKNITFTPAKAEIHKVTKDHHDPKLLMQLGTGMELKEGKILVDITALDNHFNAATSRKFRAEAPVDDLNNWTYTELSKQDKSVVSSNHVAQEIIAWDNKPKPDENGKITYRFYDPEKDGKVDFRQVEFRYIKGFLGVLSEKLPDWGVVKPSPRTTWVLWHKEKGLTLLLTRKPILTEARSASEFENPDDSNDNFAGQWLSDDGKTLYFAACTVLRRYPPYNVKYDLLYNGIRIMAVIKTTDGINFTRSYLALPDETDPQGTQHYGANIIRYRNGNGLRIGFLMRYRANEQRIFQELTYSWDGARWMRFKQPLVDNGPKGSWTAGYISASPFAVEANGKVYYLLCWTTDAYHICSELMWLDNYQNTTAGAVKRHMEPRGIKDWPLFKQFNGYEELAEYVRNSKINVGLMSWRKDGLFAATAGNEAASLLTHAVKAQGGLQINAVVENDGYIELQLTDEAGNILPNYTKRITAVDELALKVFDSLPENSFRIKMNLKNAKLYTIEFTK